MWTRCTSYNRKPIRIMTLGVRAGQLRYAMTYESERGVHATGKRMAWERADELFERA